MSVVVPTIDQRLLAVCLRLRVLAAQIEERWQFGTVHLFAEEHVIQAHNHWRLEVPVPELDDYLRDPANGPLAVLPLSIGDATLMLRRVVEECKGVRGIASPCAPNPELLAEIVDLLGRAKDGSVPEVA